MTFPAFLPRVRTLLRSVRGAFDLPSILVGVLVVGVMTLGVTAVVFGVIPFSQDKAAQQDLAAHRTAQGAARTQDGKFMDSASLASAGYIRQASNTAFGTDAAGTCYVGVARSDTGRLFFSTDSIQNPQELDGSTDTGCINRPTLTSLVASAGGTLPPPGGALLMAWGYNYNGLLATSNTDYNPYLMTPTDVPAMTGKSITAISASPNHTCAVADSDLYCWGQGYQGNLGNGSYAQNNVPTKVSALAGKSITDIAADGHTCAIADGEVYCWGQGSWGELGNGTTTISNVPVKVTGLAGKNATQVEVSWNHTCAIADGEVYCWGWGQRGQLGYGSYNTSAVPVKVVGLGGKPATALAIGNVSSCAVASGHTYCWGENTLGQIGDGSMASRPAPVEVTTLSGKNVTALSSGRDSICAVADGVYCWGDNTKGQLGLGDTSDRNTPTLVTALNGMKVVSLQHNGYVGCASTGSTTYCWGDNSSGDVGTGDQAAHAVPTNIPALEGKTVIALAAGRALVK